MNRPHYYYNMLFLRKLLQNVKFLRKQAAALSFKAFMVSFFDIVVNIVTEVDGDLDE